MGVILGTPTTIITPQIAWIVILKPVGTFYLFIYLLGFDSYTTLSQQPHNNPLHEGGPQCVGLNVWGPPSCEELLCDCCVGVVNLTFSLFILFLTFLKEFK